MGNCVACGPVASRVGDEYYSTHPRSRAKAVRGNLVKTLRTNIDLDYDIDFDHILGKGGCGVVVLGKVRAASQEVAIKIVDKKNVDVGRLDREIKLLKDMDHSSVIRIFSVYDSSSLTYLVMEICDGGHLGNLISLEATKYVPEAKAKLLASQLVAAVAYIHSKGIAHRDIKLQNVLVERHAHDYVNLKLIDFGYAARFEGALPMRTKCGTPYTTAPEVIREEYDERCDVWSLGVVLFIMLSGRRPFELQRGKQGEDAARAVMITDILAGRFNFSQKAWKAVSAEGVAFVKELMQPNYKRRIRSAEVLAHPWLKSSIRTNLTKVITSGYSKNALNNLKKSTRQSALQKTGMMAVVFGIPATKTSRMLQLFQYFDTDRSGTISPFEFADAMTIVSPDLGQAEVTQLFDTLDYDCNGSISFTEFLAATLDPCEVDIAELNKAFELFDADGNGYIDRSEIAKVIKFHFEQRKLNDARGGSCAKTDTSFCSEGGFGHDVDDTVDSIFKVADANLDGAISRPEFVEAMTGLRCCEETDEEEPSGAEPPRFTDELPLA